MASNTPRTVYRDHVQSSILVVVVGLFLLVALARERRRKVVFAVATVSETASVKNTENNVPQTKQKIDLIQLYKNI